MATETRNKKKARLFVPPTFEGVTTSAILDEAIEHAKVELDVRYCNSLDFREYDQFVDVDFNIVLGFPYRGYNLPEQFYQTVDVPFADFIHISTYGEEIRGENIQSLVSPDVDPVKELFNLMDNTPESILLSAYILKTAESFKVLSMVGAVNAYRTWTWEGNNITRLLLALYHAGYTSMPKMIRGLSLQEAVRTYAPIIKGQLDYMSTYIQKKRDMTKRYYVDIEGTTCILKVVFAEEYINELANALLNEEMEGSSVIVCVGRTTKGNDLFSIRTRNVDANKIAYLINEGGGKYNVASVFSSVDYPKFMGHVIKSVIDKNQQNMV